MKDKTPKPVLSVRNLHVATTGRTPTEILKGISFDVNPGEVLCLVGESGSGKSVTSLVAMDLLQKQEIRPTGGAVLLNGEDILTATPERTKALRGAEMAMIFQEPMTALNPVLRIGLQMEEVFLAHRKMTARARRKAVLEAFEAVQLPDPPRIYDSFPHQLSGGQRQRVMIAMALALKPRLLIADEPTTALDVTTQKQILTVLFITHDLGVVVDIADRVCVMRKGEVMETGPVRALLAAPKTDYTRSLLAAIPSLTPPEPIGGERGDVVLQASVLCKEFRLGSTLARLTGRPDHVVKAVDEVSFRLRRGRTLGIVGESGSGKSTVARCVMRLEDPSSGAILLDGHDISTVQGVALRQARKRLQMVFQDPNRSLNPRIPILESLSEGPMNYGEDRDSIHARAAEVMETVGLDASGLSRYPHQFSGGQRQRIAIARALLMEPEIIVADEAVSALDVSVQAQVLDLLDRIRRERNLSMLFITHDLRVAAQICDEVMVMRKGRVVEMGLASEVLANPKHAYTAALIDAAPGRSWDFEAGRPVAMETSA
jgi:peptide/nickel transport system ATP-binding protein